MTDLPLPLSHLEIHLDRLCWNYHLLQKKLTRGCDLAAAVKADAYGLGAADVVPALYQAGCRHFYVATLEEGMSVRAALAIAGHNQIESRAQIYVLNGISGGGAADKIADEFLRQGLIPVLNTRGDIEQWAAVAARREKNLPAVLHLDTGMHRLGLPEAEAAWLIQNRAVLAPLDIRLVMSHLACADTPDHPQNRRQLEKFKQASAALHLPAGLSLANSSGIFLGNDYHFDQVRPGCALYGINPTPPAPNPMQGVVTLKARILQIHEAAAGETVGYGAAYQAAAAVRLATISAGYADGLLRSFGKNGMVYIGGTACPLAGRVSMDLVVADVTGAIAAVGDFAEFIGIGACSQTVDDMAAAAGTIGYEVLTSLGKRYKRVYIKS